MRGLIGVVLAMGMVACSSGSSDSTSGGGTTTAASGATGTTGGDSGGDGGDGSSSGTTGGMQVTGTPLGQLCDSTHACHDSQDCVSAGTGKQSFCTIECGMTAGGAKKPPSGGDALCAAADTYGGTGACDLTVMNKNGTLTWDCGLQCGTVGSNNYGDCPTGLTCSSMNLCQ